MTLVAASTHTSVRLPMACELYGVSDRSLVIGRVMSIVFLCVLARVGEGEVLQRFARFLLITCACLGSKANAQAARSHFF